jgi:RNA-directed DNA polymerase
MATLLILEPIFEADFLDCSYGFRPGRTAHEALEEVRDHIKAGYRAVYDVDLKGYFDTIPHDKLMAALRVRIVDRSVLKLIRMWLTAPVIDDEGDGPTRVTRPSQGTPQGGVISPLLANAFLHWFDKVFQGPNGPACWANARLVRYADDFVILARYIGPRIVQFVESIIEERMGLTINRDKTSIADLNQGDRLDFLGYTFSYAPDRQGRGHMYLNPTPSRKALARERQAIRALTDRRYCYKPIPALIRTINRQLVGWCQYFRFGYPRHAYRQISWYTYQRLWAHLRRRSQRRYRPPKTKTLYRHLVDLGFLTSADMARAASL